MSIVQKFYDSMASHYDKLFLDWDKTTEEQAAFLDSIFRENGFGICSRVLDCACGIGTQTVGLARMGYDITASDISEGALTQAKGRASEKGLEIRFEKADFRTLSDTFDEKFDIVIAMDNALPHMLTAEDLNNAVQSIVNQLKSGGIFVASIRDYDTLLKIKPPYSPPYIHKTDVGKRVSFQTWEWEKDSYRLTQYIIDDENNLQISKFDCEYRAVRRDEPTNLLLTHGCSNVEWKTPEETGFYQPVVIAEK